MEDNTGTLLALVSIVAPLLIAGLIIFLVMRRQSQRVRAAQQRLADHNEWLARAVWAGATIVSVRQSMLTEDARGTAKVDLRLDVQAPGGQPYQATTAWLVDLAALPPFQPSQTVSVKIDYDRSL